MWEFWLSCKTIKFALPLLVGAAWAIGGWVSHTIAYILFGVAFVWATLAFLHWFKSRKRKSLTEKRTQSKLVVGGLIGKSSGGKVSNSHFRGKIIIQGEPEEIDAGGLIGQSENTEVVDSSADAEIEYKQDDGC